MANKSTGAVFRQKKKKQSQFADAALRAAAIHYIDPSEAKEKDGKVEMIETRIYVGLNDSQTREQKYETEEYLTILKEVCRKYHVAFSVDVEEGGYYHEDGEYTEENSLILVLIDVDKNTVQDIAKHLCSIFHQEAVLVTEDKVEGYFINRKEV